MIPGAPDRCPTCHRKATRSSDQNRHYWLLLHAIADKLAPGGEHYNAETWHTYCKSRWLGCDDVALPNGKVMVIPRSTARLSTDRFAEYVSAIEAWAAERDIYLEEIAA